MAFSSSILTRLYVGPFARHAHARSATLSADTDTIEVSVLGDTSKQFISGNDTTTFTCDGPLDPDIPGFSGSAFFLIGAKASTTPTPITFLPLGSGQAGAWLMDSIETGWDTTAAHDSTVDYTLNAQITGLTDLNGVVLEDNTTVTATTNGTGVDNGAATSNGAVFHLHVTAYTGSASDVITIEGSTSVGFGSPDTLATFTAVSGVGSQRIEVTGTVHRYLRVVDTVTGTGSVTRFVACSRR